ncbi:hypothetical protein BH11ARM2_BH11ARM2_32420 [soil metagenome]
MALLNRYGGIVGKPRLSEVLFDRSEHSFSSLASFESNVDAIDAGLRFAIGRLDYIAVVGPSGWGKTHLLDAIARRLRHSGVGEATEILSVCDDLNSLDTPSPVLLDDVQEVLARPRLRQTLTVALERRVRGGKPTALSFTLPKATRPLSAFLPSLRIWEIATMGEPVGGEREKLLLQMAAREELAFSPALSRILARHMHGDGRTLSGALKRLRLSGTQWLDAPSTLRAVGTLDPFFADNSAWDLKDRVFRAAETAHSRFGRVIAADLALYTLLHEANMNEIDVARAARITPADAYQRTARFRAQIASDPAAGAYVRQFIDVVVEGLQQE